MKYADTNSLKAMVKNIKTSFATISLCEDLADALMQLAEVSVTKTELSQGLSDTAKGMMGYLMAANDRIEEVNKVAEATARVSGLTPDDIQAVIEWDTTLTNIDSKWENDTTIWILPPIDLSNVTTAREAWYGSDLAGWKGYLDLSKCADLSYAMMLCANLAGSIAASDIVWPKVPCQYQFMFKDDADLKGVDGTITNARGAQGMFMNCEFLEHAPSFRDDAARCVGLAYMYYHCYKLRYAHVPNTELVTDFTRTFEKCRELVRITGILHFNSSTQYDYMFYECSKLAQVEMRLKRGTGAWAGYKFTDLSAWGDDSIMGGTAASTSLKNTLDNLENIPSDPNMAWSTNTLQLHSNLQSRITQAQIAAASAKKWTITFS